MNEAATAEVLPEIFVSIMPEKYWDEVEHLLAPACARPGSGITLPELKERIRRKKAVLFGVVHDGQNVAAGTMERRVGLKSTQLVLTTLGGENMEEWIEALSTGMEHLAKAWACTHIVCIGRPGWQKVLTPFGYHTANIEMIKELTP